MPLHTLASGPRLQALVNWEAAPRSGMRVNLEPVRDLLARLGNPQHRWHSVHVTGTKGKGSVCALIEAGLLNADLRAGRYASPHLEHITERICHGGRPVSTAEFDRVATLALDARDAACQAGTAAQQATWFDVLTAAAFRSFADAGLDWAVAEVGLGGLHDSTNVIVPELAIVTNIGLEHTEVLGPTVESIARHKAGIAKSGRPLLTGEPADQAAGQVLAQVAQAQGAPFHAVDLSRWPGITRRNEALARAALDLLGHRGFNSPARGGAPLSAADLDDAAVKACRLPGRLERITLRRPSDGQAVTVVLDGAHVDFALTSLLDELQAQAPASGLPTVLLALAVDKDIGRIVAALVGRVRQVVCTALPSGRASHAPESLRDHCLQQGLPATAVVDAQAALDAALTQTPAGGTLVVTGSLLLVGHLRPRVCPHPRGST